MLEGGPLDHNIETLGYNIIGGDKRKINVGFIKKVGIPDGPLLGKLQNGKSIIWKGKKINVNKATHIVKGKKITNKDKSSKVEKLKRLAKLKKKKQNHYYKTLQSLTWLEKKLSLYL